MSPITWIKAYVLGVLADLCEPFDVPDPIAPGELPTLVDRFIRGVGEGARERLANLPRNPMFEAVREDDQRPLPPAIPPEAMRMVQPPPPAINRVMAAPPLRGSLRERMQRAKERR